MFLKAPVLWHKRANNRDGLRSLPPFSPGNSQYILHKH